VGEAVWTGANTATGATRGVLLAAAAVGLGAAAVIAPASDEMLTDRIIRPCSELKEAEWVNMDREGVPVALVAFAVERGDELSAAGLSGGAEASEAT